VNDITSIIRQLEAQKAAIERALSALRDVSSTTDSGGAPRSSSTTKQPRKRRLSPEGRARIADAARRRWAEKREAEASSQPSTKKAKATRKARAKQA
jgi:hypothetical protein